MINDKLIEFLTRNYPVICEQRVKDDMEWEDVIAHVIVSQDKVIGELESAKYALEQNATAASEDRDAQADGTDSTFMDDDDAGVSDAD